MDATAETALKIALAILANWRVTHLLAREDGPGDLIARARAAMGVGAWARMLDCFQCMSLWVALPMTAWITTAPLDAVLVWLAISGAACLCERIGAPEMVVHAMPAPDLEKDDGMLRPNA